MVKNNLELVLFDFCETIVSKQTANSFINYIAHNRKSFWTTSISKLEFFLIKTRFFALIDKIAPTFNISKRFNVLKIRGLEKKDISNIANSFYEEFIVPNFNSEILEILMENLNSENKIVILISGGYKDYLEIFCNNYNIKYLLSSQLDYKKNIYTGFIKGLDCMHENKVNLLEQMLRKEKIFFNTSTLYSDSISDLPLFKWSDYKNVISYNKSQSWTIKYGFNEIILKRND